MVSSSGMPVSLKTDLRFPITGQQGHGSRNIQRDQIERKNERKMSAKSVSYTHLTLPTILLV